MCVWRPRILRRLPIPEGPIHLLSWCLLRSPFAESVGRITAALPTLALYRSHVNSRYGSSWSAV